MTERLLLNLFVGITPVVAYQLIMLNNSWDGQATRSRAVLGVLCGLSCILCMTYPIMNGTGFLWDLRWVPFLLAVIYGRFTGGIICTAITVLYRFSLGSVAPSLEVLIDAVVIFSFVLACVRDRNRESWTFRKKLLMSTLISAGTYIFVMSSIYLYFVYIHKAAFFRHQGILFYATYLIVTVSAYLASVTLIENLIKQQILRQELQNAEKLRLLGDMAASFAHEIRNPLTVAAGFIQLIIESIENKKHMENLQLVSSELERAEHIINDYLNFAKPEISKSQVISINQTLERIVSTMSPFATMHKVQIQLENESSFDVYIDDGKFKQAILNVIKNSIEAISNGGTINIRSFQQGDSVIIEITDNGNGMTEAQLHRLGTPFYSTKSKGTGLGLMVTFQLIKAMRGDLHFESAVGQGTSARLSFPLHHDSSLT